MQKRKAYKKTHKRKQITGALIGYCDLFPFIICAYVVMSASHYSQSSELFIS